MQGDLSDRQMLRLRNCFVGLRRCPEADLQVNLHKKGPQKRRNSVPVPKRVVEIQLEDNMEPEQQPRAMRNRSVSLNEVPRNQATLDENSNDLRLMLEVETAQGATNEEEGQVDEVQSEEGGDQMDESSMQVETDQVEGGQSNEDQEQHNETAASPTRYETSPGSDTGLENGI